MQTVTAACNAMATRFEMVLHGENAIALRAAADEAFQLIERLHAQLSLYLPSSEVSFINRHAARRPVRVEPGLFRLLQLAQRIHQETRGAFDITIAPLLRCWGFMGGTGKLPTPEAVSKARAKVGMQHVVLDEVHSTVRFDREGMMLDLGSIGKGYALELATETLLEAGVQNALLHGGTSTVCAIGKPPDAESWKVAISAPPVVQDSDPRRQSVSHANAAGREPPMAVVSLENESLSVSGVHGKSFTVDGETYGHVIDPCTGAPAQGALTAVVVLPSATETDAFSTALLLAGMAGQAEVARLRPNMRTLVAERNRETGELVVATRHLATLQATGGCS